ncbi:gap junction delta-3 protein [Ailuropoda melanoleuca]|uniref:gap junction delta-3 protein n=1 Tax=Ailuropoda melanoleuca TaxID=9646 RepID=UPI001494F580|nr:gap junction delta-3 protein [Ailuropoda melanoleuca]
MGEWAFLGSLLDAVQLQSPLVGRLWLVLMLIFRILVLATVGGAVFEDEQEEFVCNTLQPGCRQTCYDRAFPVSHYRFWLFHILLLSAPPVLFVIYSVHRAGKEAGGADAGPGPPPRRRCYLLSVALRLLAELAFLAGQALLYGFRVAPHFACAGPPCPHTVDCFVSRPTEKTVFVLFYFAVGLLSALLRPQQGVPGHRAPGPGHLEAGSRCFREDCPQDPARALPRCSRWSGGRGMNGGGSCCPP